MTGTPHRLSPADAARVVAEIAADPDRVILSTHAEQRMRLRRIMPGEVLNCLRRGSVTEGPFVNLRGNWQVRMTRHERRQRLDVVVAIEWRERLVVITAI